MPITSTPPPSKAAPKPAVKTPAKADLTKARTDALIGLGQLAQVPLIATRQTADAGAVAMHWPKVSGELAELAARDERVAKLIDPLMQAGPYAGLITAVLPFVMQLGVNHGMLQAGAMGTVPAATLSSQMDAELAKAQLEALKLQREIEMQSADVMRDIEEARKANA